MKKYLILAIVCLLAGDGYTQDLGFSQFYELPLLRNPALCGLFNGDVRVQSVYRSQWGRVAEVPFRTGGLSAEWKTRRGAKFNYATVGLQATYDIAGYSQMSRVQVLPVFSYHVNLNGEDGAYLTGSFMGGYVSRSFNTDKLQWDDQYQNGSYSANNTTNQVFKNTKAEYWDEAVGLSLTSPFANDASFYIGAGLFHFLKPSVAVYTSNAATTRLSPKWGFNAGLKLPVNEDNRFNIFADYFLQGDNILPNGHRLFMAGAFYSHDLASFGGYDESKDEKITLGAGLAYRWNDALVPVAKVDLRKFSFGLSYDVNISKLKTGSNMQGGFELTLGFKSFLSSRSGDAYQMNCPDF